MPFRSFDLLEKKKINVSISCCALLAELRLASSPFNSLSRYANENTTLELGCQSRRHKHGSARGHFHPGIIWALPSLFQLLTLDATPGCHYLTSAALTCLFPSIYLHIEPRLSGHLALLPLTMLCLWVHPLFSALLKYSYRPCGPRDA